MVLILSRAFPEYSVITAERLGDNQLPRLTQIKELRDVLFCSCQTVELGNAALMSNRMKSPPDAWQSTNP